MFSSNSAQGNKTRLRCGAYPVEGLCSAVLLYMRTHVLSGVSPVSSRCVRNRKPVTQTQHRSPVPPVGKHGRSICCGVTDMLVATPTLGLGPAPITCHVIACMLEVRMHMLYELFMRKISYGAEQEAHVRACKNYLAASSLPGTASCGSQPVANAVRLADGLADERIPINGNGRQCLGDH